MRESTINNNFISTFFSHNDEVGPILLFRQRLVDGVIVLIAQLACMGSLSCTREEKKRKT